MSELPVVYVNHGIANRYHDRIELNVNLLQYPELHDYILEHEKNHTDKAWSLQDFKHDLMSVKYSFEIIKFAFKYGRRDFLPIYKDKDRWYIDYSLLTIYIFALGAIVIIWSLM